MSGALVALLIIATASLLVVRTGPTALTMIGPNGDSTCYQADSASVGVGFGLSEVEVHVGEVVAVCGCSEAISGVAKCGL